VCGWPAAAHTTSYLSSQVSTSVRIGAGWPTGATPPMAWPVHSRTERASARPTAEAPTTAATLAVSTRWAPLVMTSSGAPSALKIRLFAIAPTSQPSWAAAVAAVGAGSGSSLTCPATPRSQSTAAKAAKLTGMPSRLAGPKATWDHATVAGSRASRGPREPGGSHLPRRRSSGRTPSPNQYASSRCG